MCMYFRNHLCALLAAYHKAAIFHKGLVCYLLLTISFTLEDFCWPRIYNTFTGKYVSEHDGELEAVNSTVCE